jgi:phage-related protein
VRTSLVQNRIARVLFYIDKKSRMVLLHGFMKKTQKTPDEDLELARSTNRGSNERDCNEREEKAQENGLQRIDLRQFSG